jgi:hypothetical protein
VAGGVLQLAALGELSGWAEQVVDYAFESCEETRRATCAECFHQASVVPLLVALTGVEPFPKGVTVLTEVGEHCGCVVELVGDGNPQDARVSLRGYVVNRGFLAYSPGPAVVFGLSARVDDVSYFVAEPALYVGDCDRLIFANVVKQRGDGFVFGSAVFEH